ncbi:MAG: DUF4834 family protein [Firmicutes bacterium]|nr:DUF4834 family protein [Bacillota bacterium]MCM1478033.1 DUF4834 family protein [Bacteroides sp.]
MGRILLAAFKLKRSYDKAMNSARDEARRERAYNRPGGWTSPRQRKGKMVDPNEGEYVEWEEVTVAEQTAETRDYGHGKRTKVSRYVSEQVSDVEWEDVTP